VQQDSYPARIDVLLAHVIGASACGHQRLVKGCMCFREATQPSEAQRPNGIAVCQTKIHPVLLRVLDEVVGNAHGIQVMGSDGKGR
jgi:hypothetical protein